MLILDGDCVRHCQVEDPRFDTGRMMEAIVYRDAIYVFVNRYTTNDRKPALRSARELLDVDRFCLLLQTQEGFSLWELAPWAQLTDTIDPEREESLSNATTAQAATESVDVAAMNLIAVIAAMRQAEPPLIRDRQYRLRIYPQVFVGQEVVDWLVRQFNFSRAAAACLGQRFLDESLARHVTGDHQFEDRFLFYRFLVDEGDLAVLQDVKDMMAVADVMAMEEAAALPMSVEPELPADESGEIDILQLALEMRDARNLVGNRRYMLRLYPRSFVGYEAVDWLVENRGLSRDRAIILGQRLLEEGLIRHVTNDHRFEDRYLFYEFLE